jgi:hypothetical protein
VPATIHFRTVSGRQAEKFATLGHISLNDAGWRESRTNWTAPLTPSADSAWDDFPAAGDLFPWVAPGVKPNRTWVYAPSRMVLAKRWTAVVTETDLAEKSRLFKESRDAYLDRVKSPLGGLGTHQFVGSFASENGPPPGAVRVGYRSFDRQWVIPDSRLMHAESPPLWEARILGQVFVVEQHAHPITDGPGLVFSALIPDMDHFKGSEGGRVLPFLHPDGTPNLAPGLVAVLSDSLSQPVTAADVLAYIAGVVANPAFTRTFADELTTPGIRIPLTMDPDLWAQAVAIGEQVLWLHTYGESFAGPYRQAGSVRYPAGDPRQPLCRTAITTMPETMTYDADRGVAVLGTGQFGPVTPAVWEYAVGGKNVLRSWINYRKAVPGGKKTSPLDYIHVEAWDPDWTAELIDMFTVLTQLVDLEPAQAQLLMKVLAGQLHTLNSLRAAGVRWPANAADRKPRRSLITADSCKQPAFEL